MVLQIRKVKGGKRSKCCVAVPSQDLKGVHKKKNNISAYFHMLVDVFRDARL